MGPTSVESAEAVNNLAVQVHCQGKYGEAMKLYLEALKIWQQNSMQSGLEIVDVLCNLSLVARKCGDLQEAVRFIKVSASGNALPWRGMCMKAVGPSSVTAICRRQLMQSTMSRGNVQPTSSG